MNKLLSRFILSFRIKARNIILILYFLVSFLGAEEVSLTLSECVRMALDKNIDLAFHRLNPEISKANLNESQGDYDLKLITNGQYGESQVPSFSDSISQSRSTQFQSEMSQKIALGTTFGLNNNFLNSTSNVNDFDRLYSSFIGVSVIQPLLKDFGTDTNMALINTSRRSLEISITAYQIQIDRIVSEVATTYSDLVFARQDFKAKEKSLSLATRLLEDNQKRVEIGVMTSLDISRAHAEVATRQQALSVATRQIQDQQNKLLLLITSEIFPWFGKTIIPSHTDPIELPLPPLEKAIQTAFVNRPDYRQINQELEKNHIQIKYLENQKLPSFDLTGSYGYSGQDEELQKSYSNSLEFEKKSWQFGFRFTYLFQNRAADGKLTEAKLKKQQSVILLKKREQEIYAEIDNSLGQVSVNREKVLSAREARRFTEESLHVEELKLKEGISTTFNLLQIQRDLANAESSENLAISDLDKSLIELNRVQGIALLSGVEKNDDKMTWTILTKLRPTI